MDGERSAGDPGTEEPLRGERTVGGLSCREVLGGLDAYLDGSLPPALRPAVEEHVRGCEQCARFGAMYARVAQRVRGLSEGAPVSQDVLDRLRARLERDIG